MRSRWIACPKQVSSYRLKSNTNFPNRTLFVAMHPSQLVGHFTASPLHAAPPFYRQSTDALHCVLPDQVARYAPTWLSPWAPKKMWRIK
jgi:hypothetical protein